MRGPARSRSAGGVWGAVAGVAAVLALVGTAAPAAAADIAVSGELRAVGWFAPRGTACGIEHTIGLDLAYDGGGAWEGLGEVTAHVAFCAVSTPGLPAPFAVVDGSFTLTTERGTLSGDVLDGYAPNPIRLVMEVTAGTGEFVGATGSFEYDEVESGFTTEGFLTRGPITGTVTVPDRPQAKDDCKNGGWRDLVDDAGEAFADQGQCVSWANQNLSPQ
jgi:hypothetical protein